MTAESEGAGLDDRAPRGDGTAMPAAPRPPEKGQSVVFFLSLLVAAILIPALIFSGILLQRTGSAQTQAIQNLAEATAGSISEAVEREVNSMLTTLRVLASGTALRDENLPSFHARARQALADTGAHVIVLDGALNQLLNTRVDYGVALGRTSDPESARFAEEKRTSVVSDGFMGRTANRWVFNVVLPPSVSRIQNRFLLLTQNAENLASALSQQNLRGGWNVSLIDSKGVVLASSYMSNDTGKPFFLGTRVATGVQAGKTSPEAGEQEYVTVVQKSDMTNWRVVLWAPSEIVDGPWRRSILSLLFGGMLVAGIALGASWLLGRQIARSARRLAHDADRLGRGEQVEAFPYPVQEFATVSAAIARASDDRHEAENEIRFLMREVAHRSKNQLTVVGSIAKQTGRSAKTLPAFLDAFQKRIHGLARSTDLLIAGGVAGVELGELVRTQIEPFRPEDPARLQLEGTTVRLGHQAAQTFGMAIHELATNAAKYGAFSSPWGSLRVRWDVEGDELRLVWREHVRRLRKRPETTGFGTQVIERMLGGTLDAKIERTFHTDGLECVFVMPMAKLRPTVAEDGSE